MIRDFSAASEIVLRPSPGLYPPEIEQRVESLWQQEQQRRGEHLYNGVILSAVGICTERIDANSSEYRYLIAQRLQPELFDVLKIRPIGVSGLFECADGLVLGRRSANVTQDAGLWELVPSGGLEDADFLAQLLLELREEVGVRSDHVSKLTPFACIEDSNSHVIDIAVAMETTLSGDEILTLHRQSGNAEYEELQIIPRDELEDFLTREQAVVEVSRLLLQR